MGENENGKLYIWSRNKLIFTKDINYEFFVDDELIDKGYSGGGASVSLKPGRHRVHVKAITYHRWRLLELSSKTMDIDIKENEYVYLICGEKYIISSYVLIFIFYLSLYSGLSNVLINENLFIGILSFLILLTCLYLLILITLHRFDKNKKMLYLRYKNE